MSNKVAFITGGSRGVGKAVAHRLAAAGWSTVIAAKTTEDTARLEGTIFTARDEIQEAHGTEVLAVKCNVIEQESVDIAVAETLERFGRIDAVINNAGALWWKNLDETPMRRFDLIMNVNARGAFYVTQAFLPQMRKQKSGHVICMSPPINKGMIPGHIAYCISKFGMTMLAYGVAEEYKADNIYGTALWPATIIESQASKNHELGDPSMWRKADILADATYEILINPDKSNNRALIDEDFLREVGYKDFDRYNCVEGGTPMSIRVPNDLE